MNYYEILKIPKTASDRQIKSSYKELVKKYHPDLYVGDKNFAEKKMKEINEAYDILSNPEKKSEYDAYLNTASHSSTNYNSTSAPSSESKTIYNDTSSKTQWSFSKWILAKFNGLNKKRQLQIFIAILILILALFLINLIEVKYYLNHFTNSSTDTSIPSNTAKNSNSQLEEDTFDEEDFDYTESDDFKTLDDFLYDLFQSYENDIFIDEYNEFENTF